MTSPEDDPYKPPESTAAQPEWQERRRPAWHLFFWVFPVPLGWAVQYVTLVVRRNQPGSPDDFFSDGAAALVAALLAIIVGSSIAGKVISRWNPKPGTKSDGMAPLWAIGFTVINCVIAFAGCVAAIPALYENR